MCRIDYTWERTAMLASNNAIQGDQNLCVIPARAQERRGTLGAPKLWPGQPSPPVIGNRSAAINPITLSPDTLTRAASAALAHELSQPLTAMVCEIQAALRWLDRPRPDIGKAIEGLRDVSGLTQHIGEVCAALQGMHSPDAVNGFRPIRIRPVLDSVVASHRAVLEQSGIFIQSSSADAVSAFGDEAQIRLVIRNLLANAIDAVRTLAPDRRRISLEAVETADHTVIIVEDSGPGVSDDHQPHIFEAFFTTKPKGMGIGLMLCESILARHGGTLRNLRGRGGESLFVAILPSRSNGLYFTCAQSPVA